MSFSYKEISTPGEGWTVEVRKGGVLKGRIRGGPEGPFALYTGVGAGMD